MGNTNIERAGDRDKKLATHQSKHEIIREGRLAEQERKKEDAKELGLAPEPDDGKQDDEH
jgi:hypothetical protein